MVDTLIFKVVILYDRCMAWSYNHSLVSSDDDDRDDDGDYDDIACIIIGVFVHGFRTHAAVRSCRLADITGLFLTLRKWR